MIDDDADALAAREAEILGQPPRIASSTSDDERREAAEWAAHLREAALGIPTRPEDLEVPEMLLAMMCHPELMRSVSSLSTQLMSRAALSDRDRELAMLRTAWLCGAPYEFGEHVRIARKMLGFSSEEIEWIIEGSSAAGWAGHDRAVIRAVEELRANAMITDETWATLAADLDDRQLFELTVLVGQATMVAYFQNSGRFRLAEYNKGLRAR